MYMISLIESIDRRPPPSSSVSPVAFLGAPAAGVAAAAGV
jgi:hypothetical protein